jgi:hypothetical protein
MDLMVWQLIFGKWMQMQVLATMQCRDVRDLH